MIYIKNQPKIDKVIKFENGSILCEIYLNDVLAHAEILDIKHNKSDYVEEVEEQTIIEKTKRKPSKRSKFNLEFKKARQSVIERDLHKCVECGGTDNLNVHHIIERNKGGSNSIDNLQTLCELCHAGKHKGQNVYKLMMQRIKGGDANARTEYYSISETGTVL